jgi:cation diffusion facilitator family transporter
VSEGPGSARHEEQHCRPAAGLNSRPRADAGGVAIARVRRQSRDEAAIVETGTWPDSLERHEQDSRLTVILALVANAFVALAKTATALVTGSASMVAEAAHSWADTGNEIFLLVAQRRSQRPANADHPGGFGREAYVWSMFAAIGLFAAGAAVSIIHGVQQLLTPEPVQHLALAYLVLALALLLEGGSFLKSARQGSQEADRADRDLLEHILATSDPTLRAVFAEDAAALVGIVIAASGIALQQATGSSVPDAVGSILVGLLLAVTSVILIDRNRRFLVGEAVQPEVRAAALANLLASDEIRSVSYLHLEYSGPQKVSLVARVDLTGDAPESLVAARIAGLEHAIEARPGISRVVLALSHPDSLPLARP